MLWVSRLKPRAERNLPLLPAPPPPLPAPPRSVPAFEEAMPRNARLPAIRSHPERHSLDSQLTVTAHTVNRVKKESTRSTARLRCNFMAWCVGSGGPVALHLGVRVDQRQGAAMDGGSLPSQPALPNSYLTPPHTHPAQRRHRPMRCRAPSRTRRPIHVVAGVGLHLACSLRRSAHATPRARSWARSLTPPVLPALGRHAQAWTPSRSGS